MVTDPIGDMIAAIKNGYLAGRASITMSHSGVKERILGILKAEGYIEEAEAVVKGGRRALMVTLKYDRKKPVVEEIRRLSRPGRRVYADKKHIPRVRNGFGVSILSTSKGIMTDAQARENGVGGELICEIW